MSQKLPAVRGKDLVRVLQKVGWDILNIHGSHFQLEHRNTKVRITVAVHVGKDIYRGLLKKILEEVGLSTDEFRKLL